MKDTVTLGRRSYAVKSRGGYARIFLMVCSAFFTAFAVISPQSVLSSVSASAEAFVKRAMPSVLLFSIASGMLMLCGFGEVCERFLGRAFRRLLGIGGAMAAPFILGAVAGFPVGAKAVCELYSRGGCSRTEAERGLALCSNPGLGFTVAGVGGAIWGDLRFGWTAWAVCLLSSLLTDRVKNGIDAVNPTVLREKDGFRSCEHGDEFSVSKTVTDSVVNGALTVLKVFGFVTFFNALASVLWGFTALIPFFDLSERPWLKAIAVSVLEFSSGVSEIASVSFPRLGPSVFFSVSGIRVARALTVAALSWSGFSVHMQAAGFTASYGFSMREYYRCKTASALLSPVLYLLFSAIAGLL